MMSTCHNYYDVNLSDNDVDLSDNDVDLSDDYVDLSEKYVVNWMAQTGHEHVFIMNS